MQMEASATTERVKVRFTVTCGTADSLTGLVQVEDVDENDERVDLDKTGVATFRVAGGKFTFVWAVKLSPAKHHSYRILAERIPEGGGAAITLRDRSSERTTSLGEDVGFDEFTV